MLKEVLVPDIGAYDNVEVIEVLVAPGDILKKDDSLVSLETEKATVEVPAPFAGVVKTVQVSVGSRVSEGSVLLMLEVEEILQAPPVALPVETAVAQEQQVFVPDIGSYSNVEVIEVLVAPGDILKKEDSIISLETEKATVEVPTPFAGVVKTVQVSVGSKVSEGSLILTMETSSALPVAPPVQASKNIAAPTPASVSVSVSAPRVSGVVHAGPGVRRFARELGVDLSKVRGTGPKNRILKQDIQTYVKAALSERQSGGSTGGMAVAPWPQTDFAKFGEITTVPLSRIKKLSGSFLHRNWVMVPHVTQFDEADITALEKFRKSQQPLAEAQGLKLTPLVFIMKAVVITLQQFPSFNASLDASGSELILKKYFHIGVAMDTPNGLVVPVVRDVDQKDYFQLAKELGELSVKARSGTLSGQEMQGSSFTISSLGGIGGTAFTPIINVPDVAILGVSKSQIKPVYNGSEFKPHLLLPLSLSYDHRVIDGAEAARFITFLAKQLSEIG